MTEGKVIQFRRGRKTISERHFLIEIQGATDKERPVNLSEKELYGRVLQEKRLKVKLLLLMEIKVL